MTKTYNCVMIGGWEEQDPQTFDSLAEAEQFAADENAHCIAELYGGDEDKWANDADSPEWVIEEVETDSDPMTVRELAAFLDTCNQDAIISIVTQHEEVTTVDPLVFAAGDCLSRHIYLYSTNDDEASNDCE